MNYQNGVKGRSDQQKGREFVFIEGWLKYKFPEYTRRFGSSERETETE